MNITIKDEYEYNVASRNMWFFFIAGGFAAAIMVVMLLVGGVTWFAIVEAVIAAICLAAGASFEVARTEYRYVQQHEEC